MHIHIKGHSLPAPTSRCTTRPVTDSVVLLPTYNERENLEAIVAAIMGAQPDFDILVIDDNSPDGTGQLADELASAHPQVSCLHRRGKEGLGRAYLAAYRHVLDSPKNYGFVIQMDADFSHPPRFLGDLVDACKTGSDVAIGSRWVPGGSVENWSPLRIAVSRGGSLYARTVLGIGVRDLTAGFVCYRRHVLETLALDRVAATGYGFQIEMKYRASRRGFRLREVPIVFPDRTRGQSKMSPAIMLEALTLVWKLRLRPL